MIAFYLLGYVLMIAVTGTLISYYCPHWAPKHAEEAPMDWFAAFFWPIGLTVMLVKALLFLVDGIAALFDEEKHVERQIAQLERQKRLEAKRAELRRLQEKAFEELMEM